jgi:phenylalanyl-tRNA synthetase beta chain
MKAPISWLNKYTIIKLPIDKLMWKLTEAGLTTESYESVSGDKVLDVEVTPNRPDWLSIVGIAREISVIQNTKFKLPIIPEIDKPKALLPIKVNIQPKLVGRYSGITIANVKVKDSPLWMQKHLKLIGLRPINNLVDITNFVMFEFGIPIHVFDYDKFISDELTVELSKGGENFISVDGIAYKLPKNALIIKDKGVVIDLAAIKGGKNTGITNSTKNIFVHVPIYDPVITRKTSQKMKLASDASYIYERGPDLGAIPRTLNRTVDLILNLSGGKIASEIIDSRNQSDFKSRILSISIDKVNQILGAELDTKTILNILNKLELSPTIKNGEVHCKIPSFRGDINIEEDLIEEISRVYGYNKFPQTLPVSSTSTEDIPFFYDRSFELFLKNTLVNLEYLESNTLSLISKNVIDKSNLDVENHIRIYNPVSLESEYFRTSIIPNLLLASKLNTDQSNLRLFEYNKVYFAPVDKSQESYRLSAIIKNGDYKDVKTILDTLLTKLNIDNVDIKPTASKKGLWHPVKSGVVEKGSKHIGFLGQINPEVLARFNIEEVVYAIELDVDNLKRLRKETKYKPVPKFPPQIEDITLILPERTRVGDVIHSIKSSSKLIANVELTDIYKDSHTFRLHYQHPNKTLTDKEAENIRKIIIKILRSKFKVDIKD